MCEKAAYAAHGIDPGARVFTRRFPSRGVNKFLHTLALWIERDRQRRALATLDDRMLRDVGVSRADAAKECRKPFWRA